ncbi:uncharacterized protein TM35_000161510, partial [Trypanosoma theileri]
MMKMNRVICVLAVLLCIACGYAMVASGAEVKKSENILVPEKRETQVQEPGPEGDLERPEVGEDGNLKEEEDEKQDDENEALPGPDEEQTHPDAGLPPAEKPNPDDTEQGDGEETGPGTPGTGGEDEGEEDDDNTQDPTAKPDQPEQPEDGKDEENDKEENDKPSTQEPTSTNAPSN